TQNTTPLRQAVLAALTGPPPLSEMDPEAVDLTDLDNALVRISADLLARSKQLVKKIDNDRLTAVATLIARYNASADASERTRLLSDAAKLLLGPDALLLPEFKIADDQSAVVQTAYDVAVAGDPLI